MSKKSRMYEVNGTRVRTWNPFVGCNFNCSYCYAPEIYKRFSKCEQCKAFTPHFHPERLQQKFKPNEIVFVCSMGDISFASIEQQNAILEVIRSNSQTTFYMQSKEPRCFLRFSNVPDNLVLGTTVETNRYSNDNTDCPLFRLLSLHLIDVNTYITIEPIFDFDVDIFIDWLKEIHTEFVYVGYLNPEWKAKKLQIPEPSLMKTLELIEELKKFTEVRLKPIRKAWSEE